MIVPPVRRKSAPHSVEVDFGAGAVSVPAGLVYLDLTGRGAIRVPPEGPVRWSELDKLRPAARSNGRAPTGV